MHLLLSFPEHLATEFVRSTPVDTATETSQPSDDDKKDVSTSGAIVQVGIFILIPVALYFLMIRPRRRAMKQQQSVQRSVEVGDEVMLTSGMYGFVTGIEEGSDVVWVEIDDDVQVRVTRAGITGKVNVSASPDSSGAASEPAGRPTLKGGSKAEPAGATETADVDE